MTIDVLSIGAFPEATNAELANRFAITRHFHRPAPDALDADLKSRIRAIATEANRGADRALIAALPKLEVIAILRGRNRFRRSRRRARAQCPGDQYPRHFDGRSGRPRHRPDARVRAPNPVRRSLRARRRLGEQRSNPARAQRRRQDHGVLGLGGIGRAIADRGAALRMRVIYSGPRRKPDAPYDYVADPIELARRSDY